MSNKVEISFSEYAELKKAEKTLNALRVAGVGNWHLYDYALAELRKEQRKEEVADDFASKVIEFLCSDADIYEPAGRGAGYAIALDQPSHENFKELLVGFVEKYNSEN